MKKGVTLLQATIGALAILFAVMLVLFLFTAKVGKTLSSKADLEGCRNSIFAAQLIERGTLGAVTPTINCPAPHYIIGGNDEAEISSVIATHLADCWYKTLGNDNRLGTVPIWSNSEICTVCSSFTLEDISLNTAQLATYLQRKRVNPSESKTYADVLDMPFLAGGTELGRLFLNPSRGPYIPLAEFIVGIVWGGDEVIQQEADPTWASFTKTAPILPRQLGELRSGDKHYLIAMNVGTLFPKVGTRVWNRGYYNHAFIINEGDLAKLKCDVLHFQSGKTLEV